MADIELYPEERNKVIEAWATIQKKYGGRPADSTNLQAMANEAVQRMREIGFNVSIDTSQFATGDDGQVYRSPVINIESRVAVETEHDHEKHAAQVQAGEYDGREGVMKADGTLGEAKSKLILPSHIK